MRRTRNTTPRDEGSLRPRGRRRSAGRAVSLVGLALLLAVGGFQLRATLWAAHSNARGHALIAQVQAATRAAASPPVLGPPAPCPTSPAVGTTLGLLEIPALDLTAPVVEGTTEDQLSVAVGHLSTSVLPGSTGTAVLEAHDV